MKNPKISAVICAAGKGERAGFGRNKLLAPLYGAPALYHTLKKFDIPEIDEVVVASSEFDFEEISALCKPFGYKTATGGATRSESVKNALKKVTGDIVLIHDGARPFVSKNLILNCIESVKQYGSGICAFKATDTAAYGLNGAICEGLERDSLYLIQTPQGFITADIVKAYNLAGDKTYTDDSSVYRDYIANPHISDGSAENVKLTFKSDFVREYAAATTYSGSADRVGFGVDVHAFGAGDNVILGGVRIPCDGSLIAHSDGDVLIHAVMDAFLSAAGLKDIGHYFPETDEKYRGADSGKLLKEVIKLVSESGYVGVNVSVSIQAEKPRLSRYIDDIKRNLSAITNIDTDSIAVAAGTCEGLGFVGEGLGIAAYCTVLLKRK